MTANCPPERMVHCPTCGARRYNRCRTTAGPVAWHHAARTSHADDPAKGRPRRTIPAEVRQALADGLPLAEVARRYRVPATTLYRHGLVAPRRPPVAATPLPPEVTRWHAEGVSLSEIARRTGMSRSALGRRGIGASGRRSA